MYIFLKGQVLTSQAVKPNTVKAIKSFLGAAGNRKFIRDYAKVC